MNTMLHNAGDDKTVWWVEVHSASSEEQDSFRVERKYKEREKIYLLKNWCVKNSADQQISTLGIKLKLELIKKSWLSSFFFFFPFLLFFFLRYKRSLNEWDSLSCVLTLMWTLQAEFKQFSPKHQIWLTCQRHASCAVQAKTSTGLKTSTGSGQGLVFFIFKIHVTSRTPICRRHCVIQQEWKL